MGEALLDEAQFVRRRDTNRAARERAEGLWVTATYERQMVLEVAVRVAEGLRHHDLFILEAAPRHEAQARAADVMGADAAVGER